MPDTRTPITGNPGIIEHAMRLSDPAAFDAAVRRQRFIDALERMRVAAYDANELWDDAGNNGAYPFTTSFDEIPGMIGEWIESTKWTP